MKALLLGNLTIDHNYTESGMFTGPGGSVFFASKFLTNSGVKTSIITPYGKDYPLVKLGRCSVFPPKPTTMKSLIFENIYKSSETRIQIVKNYSSSILPVIDDQILMKLNDIDLFIIAPILPNIRSDYISNIKKFLPKASTILLPQGFFRKVLNNGKIQYQNWIEDTEISNMADIIVLSDKDCRNINPYIDKWTKNNKLIILTRNKYGCILYGKDYRQDFKAFYIDNIIDSTGAGDIFAAAFSFYFIKYKKLADAAVFANAAAGLSLKYLPDEIKYNYNDVLIFIKNSGRRNLK